MIMLCCKSFILLFCFTEIEGWWIFTCHKFALRLSYALPGGLLGFKWCWEDIVYKYGEGDRMLFFFSQGIWVYHHDLNWFTSMLVPYIFFSHHFLCMVSKYIYYAPEQVRTSLAYNEHVIISSWADQVHHNKHSPWLSTCISNCIILIFHWRITRLSCQTCGFSLRPSCSLIIMIGAKFEASYSGLWQVEVDNSYFFFCLC